MQNKKTTGKEWDYWYDKKCKGKEREDKTPLKDYEEGNDEERRSKKFTCENECVKVWMKWERVGGNKINTGELLEWTK